MARAEHIKTTREVIDRDAEGDVTRNDNQNVAERVVWFVAGIILVLLAFRFLLSLLGANRGNGFADFIYSTSHPFVAPFFGLFNYNPTYGLSRFELYTLFAMLVYYIIALGVARLVTIDRA